MNVYLAAAWMAWSGTAAAVETHDARTDIIRHALVLRPDIRTGAVSGIQTIAFSAKKGATHLRFSVNGLLIDSATIDCDSVNFAATEQDLAVTLPTSVRTGRTSTLRIAFKGKPKRGLVIQQAAIYSSYFTCDWMSCLQNATGDKALFDLDLYLPTGMESVASGRRLADRPSDQGLTVHRWRARRPYSSYLFGFAAGALPVVQRRQGADRFSYVNATGGIADVDRLFGETPAIAAFFTAKAGLPLPDHRYTQILVGGSEAQEAADFSLIGKVALDRDISEPNTQWIIAHEMSHQWWGKLVTCATLQDFWLNEGFATFMTAAWKQHRFGEAAYQAELDVARTRLKRAADLGYDKPLAWNGAYPSLTTRRAVQYSKGALFLDRLRAELGDAAFWAGVRHYTRRFSGKTVQSVDFERSMEAASGRDLSAMFAQWVYGTPGTDH